MAEHLRLTVHARSTTELLDELGSRATLPAEIWKRLCLAFLRRMGRAQPTLAQLCALEACDLAFSIAAPIDAHHAMREAKLQAIERRAIGRGRVRTEPLPDGLYLYLRFRQIRDLVQETDQKALPTALQERWTRWGAPGKVPEAILIAATRRRRNGSPSAAALLFVSKAYGAKDPDVIHTIFRRHGYPPRGQGIWKVKGVTQDGLLNS
jgi:hypothetical protein